MITNIVNAVRIHKGGGLVYMSFMHTQLDKSSNLILLDSRVKSKLKLFLKAKVLYVRQDLVGSFLIFSIRCFYLTSFFSKKLFKLHKNDVFSEFCLNGFPPFFRFPFIHQRISILCQNRLIFSKDYDKYFTLIEKLKYLLIYRVIFRLFLRKTDILLTQTDLMKSIINHQIPNQKVIVKDHVWKTLNVINYSKGLAHNSSTSTYTILNYLSKHSVNNTIFFYPAPFIPYKNHLNLLKAFDILSSSNKHNTKLLLTLNRQELPIEFRNKPYFLFSYPLDFFAIQEIYKHVDFLVFPSLLESLGLPLIEAKLNHLPIICSDLDYVYQVCNPFRTFNPLSYKDIAMSILDTL